MKAWEIVGYTADADIWCGECAERVYGPDKDDDSRTDSEGNPVHPLFASDEWESEACGCCGCRLDELI